jgi:pimeloyl-ACP methyl ester carboxylesterase
MPFVLVHGYGVASGYLLPTAEHLAGDFPVLVPDLPGWGESDDPESALDVNALADFLAAWMHELQIDRALLLGNSFGCQIVVALADRHPSRVRGTVLVGPSLDPATLPIPKLIWLLVKDAVREHPRQLAIATRDYLRFGYGRGKETLRFMISDRIQDRLPGIRIPVLVVRGEHDPIASRTWCQSLAERAPRGRFAEMSDTAHAANFDAPESLSSLVRQFVQDEGIR